MFNRLISFRIMGKTLIKLLLIAFLLGSALYAFSQDYASTQTLPVKLNPETIFSPGDLNYDLPFPSGVYYAYEVTHFTKDSVYTWEKEVTEPIEQAFAEQRAAGGIVPPAFFTSN